ncbi:Vga family ABC-F type ribosomal protection protein [Cytobacillus gottheilii]|uniref:Vga family ABC-F type ribosomal protection protein n=1 Tax=Cytobacillus gottheilii TaxID=859144 RepID=UPI0009BA016F|nr:ABC-F type ribosomal protection protein [Cytobacillus gottheilii]
MKLIEAKSLKVFIKDRLIIDVEHLQVYSKERIGIVGKNGSGKTTLLEVLAEKRKPDSGNIHLLTSPVLLPQIKKTDTTKSGGEVTQDYIKAAMLQNPELLLADEPTTNLDTSHVEWLEKILRNWQGAFLIVSHDRAFLDALCTTIWEVNEGKIKEYKGNYSDYVQQKELERLEHERDYEKYIQKKHQLEQALEDKLKRADRATKKPKNVSLSEASITGAKPYFAKKQKKMQKTAKSIETRLEKLETVEKLKEQIPIRMVLPNERSFKNKIIIRAENIEGAFASRTLWSTKSFHIKGGDKVAIIGANGAGKTTLLKKLINGSDGITISPAAKIGYFSQNLDVLDLNQSILENVKSTSVQDETFVRTVLARLHFYRDDVYKLAGVLSGGERVKVALAKSFVSNMNTFILDEPTNYLDIDAVEALESLLSEFEGTVIFVSHDRRFISKVAHRIFDIKNGSLIIFDGDYTSYTNDKPKKSRDTSNDQLLVLETKISEILSRLSIEPSPELDAEFQRLVTEKRKLENRN